MTGYWLYNYHAYLVDSWNDRSSAWRATSLLEYPFSLSLALKLDLKIKQASWIGAYTLLIHIRSHFIYLIDTPPSPCGEGVELLSCFPLPCAGKVCEADITARCKNVFCGECKAEFYNIRGNLVNCSATGELFSLGGVLIKLCETDIFYRIQTKLWVIYHKESRKYRFWHIKFVGNLE